MSTCANAAVPGATASGSRLGMSGLGIASPPGHWAANAAAIGGGVSRVTLARQSVLQRRGEGLGAAGGIAGLAPDAVRDAEQIGPIGRVVDRIRDVDAALDQRRRESPAATSAGR